MSAVGFLYGGVVVCVIFLSYYRSVPKRVAAIRLDELNQ